MIGTKSFKHVLAEGPVFIPGGYDGLSCRILEHNGSQAIYLSADCVAASFSGVPDASLMASSDLIDIVQRVAAVINVPLVVDIDAGFGSEINVIRTCERIASSGAKAVVLSDKEFLRMPDHPTYVPRERFMGKLEAALHTLAGTDCLVIAKIDSVAENGLDACIETANRAIDCGVTATCITNVTAREELERICREVRGIKAFEMVSGSNGGFSFEELTNMGFSIIWAPYIAVAGAMMCMQDLAEDAAIHKNDFRAEEIGYSAHIKFDLLKIHEWYALGQKFNKEVQDASAIDPDDYLKKEQAAKKQ